MHPSTLKVVWELPIGSYLGEENRKSLQHNLIDFFLYYELEDCHSQLQPCHYIHIVDLWGFLPKIWIEAQEAPLPFWPTMSLLAKLLP